MTEDQNDQTTRRAAERPGGGDHSDPSARDHGPGRHPHAGRRLPRSRSEPLPLPQQPDTPPMGVPQGETTPPAGSTPPQGTYAMGALAGNPVLGDAPAGTIRWPPAHRPRRPDVAGAPGGRLQAPRAATHRVRNGLLAGAAALAVLGAGIGIGHATSGNSPTTQAFSPASGTHPRALRLGVCGERLGWLGSSSNPFGNGRIFGGSGNSGNTGSSGTPAAATRDRPTPRDRAT